jgi:hypothetical protein
MEYDLLSNDWSRIDLLKDEHLRSETLYLEQTFRWGLQHGRSWGVVFIRDGDLTVSGNSTDYEVAVRFCKAITPGGYVIDIGLSQDPIRLQGSNDRHSDLVVPLYLGVAVVKEYANAGASQTGALLDRPALKWRYLLSTTETEPDVDWLQIGRMRKSGSQFVLDPQFIPQCVHLRSHPVLYGIAGQIARTAGQSLISLDHAGKKRIDRDHEAGLEWYAMLTAAAAAVAPAAVLLDWDIHPRAYLERLITVLNACAVLVPMIPVENATWDRAKPVIDNALKYIQTGGPDGYPSILSSANISRPDPNGQTIAAGAAYESGAFEPEPTRPNRFWWEAFYLIQVAFKALADLIAELTPRAGEQKQQEERPTLITKSEPVTRVPWR